MTTTPSPEMVEVQELWKRCKKCDKFFPDQTSHLCPTPSPDWKKSGVVRKLHLTVMGAKTAVEAEKAITDTISDLLVEEKRKRDAEWVEALDKSKERGAKWVSELLAPLTHNI